MTQLRHCCSVYLCCGLLLCCLIFCEWEGQTCLSASMSRNQCLCAKAHGHFLTLVTAKANPNQDFLQPQPFWVLPMMGHGHYHSRSHNPSAPVPYLQKWPTPAAEEEASHTAVDVYVVIWPGGEFHPFCRIDLGPAARCFMSPPKLLGISVCLFNSSVCNYGCSIYLCECHSLFSWSNQVLLKQ